MKKSILLFAFFVFVIHLGYSQKYFTRDGKISFYSEAPLERIEAHNAKATSVLDKETSRMEFAILIKAFQFEKALMQEHFNENYMESSKYPKATFKGQIDDPSVINYGKNGEYEVQVSGDLTIHGATQAVTTPGMISINDGEIAATASFDVAVADYNIRIPPVVGEKIAKIVNIVVEVQYQPLKQ